jgi:ABC-2 type transport system ATP-binding protein
VNSDSVISVRDLRKDFSVLRPVTGRFKKIRNYFLPQYEVLNAVDTINFEVKRGERIAFIGPNGAGKSTTIKLLTGIFQPTSGNVKILGMNPFSQRAKVAYKIGTIFGQRSQLWHHLPPINSFTLLATIYDIDKREFKKRLDQLYSIFDLERIAMRTVKELSLGERMRCELVASLLHHPEILFLDEPTIGLDIISKSAIRKLVYERAERDGTTIFLTSHDVADIEQVCDRIILINNGKIVIDASVKEVKKRGDLPLEDIIKEMYSL